jgi:hypothetical protein
LGAGDIGNQWTFERGIGKGRGMRLGIHGKTAAWAARIGARFGRSIAARRMAMLLHAPGSRLTLMVEQRWLRTIVNWSTRFQLSIAARANEPTPLRREPAAPAGPELVTRWRERILDEHPQIERAPGGESLIGERAKIFNWNRVESVLRSERTSFERYFVHGHNTTTVQMVTRMADRASRRADRVESPVQMTGHRAMTLRREPVRTAVSKEPPVERNGRRSELPIAQPPAMPAIDVNQLAEQVIRQIDRRVVARRERMGRI